MGSEARRAATALAAVGGVGLTVIGATTIAAVLARVLVTPPRHRDDVRILDVDDRGIRLTRTKDTQLPGRYALWVGDRLVRIGEILDEDADSVTRAFTSRARARVGARRTARFSGYHLYRPRDLGLPFEPVTVETELGVAPAWIIGDQDARTWCIQVHGRGVNRRETLRAVPTFAGRGIPSLTVSYRNDREAPRTRDGRYRLGLDEWHDVDDAIDLAIERGAERIVIMGWSMGGQIALQLARRSRHRRRIVGLVLDSPVVAWGPTLAFHTRLARLPRAFVHLATSLLESPASRLAGTREELDFDALDGVAHADAYTAPMLLMHSADDAYVPPDASRALAEARADIVEYHEWTGARHTKLWNYDEDRYVRTIERWLDAHGIDGD